MVHENCALLSYYALSSDNSIPTFRDDPSNPSSIIRHRYHSTDFLGNIIYRLVVTTMSLNRLSVGKCHISGPNTSSVTFMVMWVAVEVDCG
jgi:hypothetical protein